MNNSRVEHFEKVDTVANRQDRENSKSAITTGNCCSNESLADNAD